MERFWNERYEIHEYLYGTEPNKFFKRCLEKIKKPGHLLLPADGEGRNGVYAASSQWHVTSFDISTTAQRKALELATAKKVNLNYHIQAIDNLFSCDQQFDAIGLIYVHLQPHVRSYFHGQLLNCLKPGGYLIMEAFSKAQLGNHSGGPKDPEMLYDIDTIRDDFDDLEILSIEEKNTILDEGDYHQGKASVIRFFGRKSQFALN